MIKKKDEFSIASEVGVVTGIAILCFGLSMAWRPLGFIVGGFLIAAASFLAGYAPARNFTTKNQ